MSGNEPTQEVRESQIEGERSTDVQTSPLSLLSRLRAAFSAAKKDKITYWKLEIFASVVAIGTAVVGPVWLASSLGVLSIGIKVIGKIFAARARAAFRLAERLRRFDFQAKTLGWPVPARDLVDLLLIMSPAMEQAARALAPRDV